MKKKNYYILSDGKLKRYENTIYFENKDGKKPIPINAIYAIYALGSLSVTSKALSLLASEGVCIHFFNRSGFYVGSFYPRETLISGDMVVKQVQHHIDEEKRLFLAKAFVEGSILNMSKVLAYYGLNDFRVEVENALQSLANAKTVAEIMGAEATARNAYYSAFDSILKNFEFGKRSRQPPENEVNAMISFGNSLLYSTVLSEIYHTQLHPAISYLHEPSERRFSLALDIAELFKPMIVDRTIFYLVNKGIVSEGDFNRDLKSVLLNESGKRKFLSAYNDKLNTTVKHRGLGRNVSYQRLIRLECYKLAKHLIGVEKYKPFVMWW
ncbi:CRISPR-associated protein, Cas1 family [Archaeoglobus sulfaticallidus PM70-1]|uniref:CRISPR-associated endonuclease Cas1 n=1 Tax=Archaeoglobus sulfaticallidus PM70-1 TaxID=387631 RepID=N0BG15_9EURY|nr:type I-B CRISPR-associated endonuclease Cas1b [Archaeoglobus sulfaticallidus]AGK61242.1 CRISPR-associated protein, Cas1 family [Archaeoglobus sulfaticallidus PM70-1]